MKKIHLIRSVGKRAFTTSSVPVSSKLGRNLIFGQDSDKILSAVRAVAKEGKEVEKIDLTSTFVLAE